MYTVKKHEDVLIAAKETEQANSTQMVEAS